MKRKQVLTFILAVIVILTWSCDNSKDPEKTYSRGDIRQDQVLGTFPVHFIELLLEDYNVPYTPVYEVEVVKIVYTTVNAQGDLVDASGALFYPVGVDNLPVMEINHGTVASRNLVASVSPSNSPEGAIGMLAASIGYYVSIPDYLGLGVSDELHPYVHAESNALSVIDFLVATYEYAEETELDLVDQLFLGGYSEGGYITMALQKELEAHHADEFTITAVAPMAGPYDLAGNVDFLFQQDEYDSPAYVAYILAAYNDIYNWNRLDEIFLAPYADMVPDLFDGSHTIGTINDQLPGSISQLLTGSFITGYGDGSDSDIINAFQDNTLLDWAPFTPIRLIHGDADEIVSYQNALTALEVLGESSTSTVELVTIPGGTHAGASAAAVEAMLDWFESMRNR